MSTTTPILGLTIPVLADPSNIETSLHPFMNAIETYAVPRFATASARSAGLPSPTNGNLAVVTGSDEADLYNGSTWIEAFWTNPWKTYTPTVAFSGGNNSGSVSGRYRKVGTMVDVAVQFIFNSSTDIGTSQEFSLPIAVRATDWQAGNLFIYDASLVRGYPGSVLTVNTTTVRMTYTGGFSPVWPNAAGDAIVFSISYEAAP